MNVSIDVKMLAQLARLEVSESEVKDLEKELPGILAFVETIQQVDVSGDIHGNDPRTVMREDMNPHEGGIYTEALLSAAPGRTKDHIVVKQVVSRKSARHEEKKEM
jgi:aspartyl/glutamyl-tRNA(Asn/Gln) amidotransferase C subunit